MGAPTKLTPTVQDLICEAIAQGNYYEPACALAGIAYFTFNRWMHEGEEAKSGAKREFYEAVTRAEAEAEARVVAFWQAQTPTDWQACRDFLARRHPDRWGPRDKHQITGAQDGPIEVAGHVSVEPASIAAFRATLTTLGLGLDLADASAILPAPTD